MEEMGALCFFYPPDTPKEAKYTISEEDLAVKYIELAGKIAHKAVSKTPKGGIKVGFEGMGPYFVYVDYGSAATIANEVKTLRLRPNGPMLQLRARRQDSLSSGFKGFTQAHQR